MEIRLIHSNSKNKTRHRLGTFVNTCLSFFENLGCVRNPGQVYGMKNKLNCPKMSLLISPTPVKATEHFLLFLCVDYPDILTSCRQGKKGEGKARRRIIIRERRIWRAGVELLSTKEEFGGAASDHCERRKNLEGWRWITMREGRIWRAGVK